MIEFILMTCAGFALFLGARHLDRVVTRYEPRLAAIEPAIPAICLVSEIAGLMICVAGLGETLWTAWS